MKFYCSHCKQKLEAPEEIFGTEIACPACEQIILVPSKEISKKPNPESPRKIKKKKIIKARPRQQKPPSKPNNKKRTVLLLSAIICLTFGTYSFSKIETKTDDNNISISKSENISVNEAHHGSLSLTELKPFINKYCTDCHNEDKEKGGLRLDNVDYTLKKHSSVENWSNILDTLNLSEMPPRKAAQPEDKEMMMAIAALTEKLTVAHKTLAQTGGIIKMRHLNKREYYNSIRDLLGIYLPDDLMADDLVEGFDTNGSKIINHRDIEKYLEIARYAVKKSIQLTYSGSKTYENLKGIAANSSNVPYGEFPINLLDDNPNTKWYTGKSGGPHWVRVDLENAQALPRYSFTSANDDPARDPKNWKVKASNDGEHWTVIDSRSGIDFPHRHQKLSFTTSSKDAYKHFLFELENNRGPSCQLADIGGLSLGQLKEIPLSRWKGKWDLINGGETIKLPNKNFGNGYRFIMKAKAYSEEDARVKVELGRAGHGQHGSEVIGWIDLKNKKGVLQEFEIPFQTQDHKNHEIHIEVGRVKGARFIEQEIVGPLLNHGDFRNQMIGLAKSSSDSDVKSVLRKFAEKAFRGQGLDETYLEGLMSIYKKQAITKPKHNLRGVHNYLVEPLAIILSSPSFLYIKEKGTEKTGKLTQSEYAIRLANFLWSAPPDDELYNLAKAGKLDDPKIRKQQMQRMLRSDKAKSSQSSFINQWLGMDRYDETDIPEYKLKSDFRVSARQEPAEYFKYMVQNNRPVDELIDSDYVVIDHILAKQYGIDDVQHGFKKVQLPRGHERGGLLTQAAFLIMGSNNGRNSPTIRGTLIRESFLHSPPPPPPPNVPTIDRDLNNSATVRDIVKVHQETPQCASCHDRIDPIGLGLENFNHLGQFVEKEWVNNPNHIIIGDFEKDEFTKWQPEGTFVNKGFISHDLRSYVQGWVGRGLATSAGRGGGVGTLTSPEFKVEKRYCNFLIAGKGKTRLELIIGEQVVEIARGDNPGKLEPKYFDLQKYLGKSAKLRIVDEDSFGGGDGWRETVGTISVDHIYLADTKVKKDISIAHFEGEDFGDWKVTGTAFGDKPKEEYFRYYTGKVASSESSKDASGKGDLGTLTSPKILVTHKFLNFRMKKSGYDHRYLYVQLLHKGKVVDTFYPHDSGWRPKTFDLRNLQGEYIQIRAVDDDKRTYKVHNKKNPLGYSLKVDQFRLSNIPNNPDKHHLHVHLPVDASGYLPSGEEYGDYKGFKASLMKNKDRLAESIYSSLLSYGIGRNIEFSDRDEIHRSLNELKANNYLLQDILFKVINSPLFSTKTKVVK